MCIRDSTEVAAVEAEGAGHRWALLRRRLRIGLPGSGTVAGVQLHPAPEASPTPGNTSASSHAGAGDA